MAGIVAEPYELLEPQYIFEPNSTSTPMLELAHVEFKHTIEPPPVAKKELSFEPVKFEDVTLIVSKVTRFELLLTHKA